MPRDKKRKTVSIDADIHDRLTQDGVNASAVVNKLLREYYDLGKSSEAALYVRRREKEEELKDSRRKRARHDDRADRLERELDDLSERIRNREENTHANVEKVVDLIHSGNYDRGDLTPDATLVRDLASDAGLGPDTFVDRVIQELDS